MRTARGLWEFVRATSGWLVQKTGVFLARVFLRPPDVDGVRIVVFAGGDVSHNTERVAEALHLIARYTPHRYQRLVRDLQWVIAVPHANFQFLPSIWGCAVDAEWLDRAGVVDIACVVMHEATHARLWRMGFRYAPDCRERVERLCLKAEAELLRRMGREKDATAALKRISQRWWEA